MNYKVIDNFLPTEMFMVLKKFITSDAFPYYYQPVINSSHTEEDKEMYMTHKLFDLAEEDVHSMYFNNFKPILKVLGAKSLIRMKVNLYPKTATNVVHEKHKDYDFKHNGCVLSFNTCNGGTLLENDTVIESVENRALLFDASRFHSSMTCTDSKARFNININYF